MTHRITEAALLRQQQLMVFNWLPAAYAHDDWLGVWARLLSPRDAAPARLLRRASAALLERSGLAQRYLREAEPCAWAMRPVAQLRPVAVKLGVAMLGGWVRNAIEREQVQQQLTVLTPAQRAEALAAANTLSALPYPANHPTLHAPLHPPLPPALHPTIHSTGYPTHYPTEYPTHHPAHYPAATSCWPLARLDPHAVSELGFAGLAALLDDDSGSRQRFLMRLPRGMVGSLVFDSSQKAEAEQLVAAALSELLPSNAPLTAEASAASTGPGSPQ